MEYENKYASDGKGNLGVTLGAIGTGLGVLSGGLNSLPIVGNRTGCTCSEDHYINRYEAAQSARISELETEVKLRDANTFTMGEMGKLRDYVDGKFSNIEAQICQQNVYNATNNAAINCINGQIAQLMSLTKLVIPNSSICPAVSPETTTTTTG